MTKETCERLAAHFERLGNAEEAAVYKARAKEHEKAVASAPAEKKSDSKSK